MTNATKGTTEHAPKIVSARERQIRWADRVGLKHVKGYCTSPEANLPWLTDRIREEVSEGDGGEFGKPGQRARICALHSSAALGVNFFGYWQERLRTPLQAALGIESAIVNLQYERKFPTGVRPRSPNMDVTLELADGTLLAIECKFTEWLGSSGSKSLRDPYLPKDRRRWAEAGLHGAQLAAETYLTAPGFAHLDVPQLLKHMLGLASQGQPWRLLLLWYEEPRPEAFQMGVEIAHFRRLLGSDGAKFSTMTYQELWNRLVGQLGDADRGYAEYMGDRYFPPDWFELSRKGTLPDDSPRASKSLQDRMNNEAQFADPEVMRKFMREHGGLTPMQYALSLFPSAAKVVAEAFPHLVPPKDSSSEDG